MQRPLFLKYAPKSRPIMPIPSGRNDVLSSIGDEKIESILRSKGLGENEPDMMNLTTMNPATRRLIRVMPDDAKKTSDMFDLLLGDNLEGRKEFIAKEGSNYIDMADVS